MLDLVTIINSPIVIATRCSVTHYIFATRITENNSIRFSRKFGCVFIRFSWNVDSEWERYSCANYNALLKNMHPCAYACIFIFTTHIIKNVRKWYPESFNYKKETIHSILITLVTAKSHEFYICLYEKRFFIFSTF